MTFRSIMWITSAVILIAASAAQAVRIDTGDNAQVLIYPLYSTQGDNETELTVRNLSETGKALRLAVREGNSGRPVLSLNIYLKDGDVWTGRLIGQPEFAATLVSDDESCTFPAIGSGLALDGNILGLIIDRNHGPDDRLSSGYMEIFELGEIEPELAGDCEQIAARWTDGVWSGQSVDFNVDLQPPGGQLSGSAFIKNTASGSSYVLDPTALADFRDTPIHTNPLSAFRPSLADVSPAVAAVRQVVQLANRRIEVETKATFSADPIDAVHAALMTSTLRGAVHSSAEDGANAALLVLLPTRAIEADRGIYGLALANSTVFPFVAPPLVASVLETDGDLRELAQPAGAADCDDFDATVNTVSLPNFFNFDHVCEPGQAEFFIPNNSTRSYLTLTFDQQLVSDEGTVFTGLPAIGHVIQTTRGSSAAGANGNFARHMLRD